MDSSTIRGGVGDDYGFLSNVELEDHDMVGGMEFQGGKDQLCASTVKHVC